ncbi:MAG: AEC family transporter [Candidatus Bathyarchaeota archaeon]|nr:MAG: AEC family transporter [Candidatus Bathyarchaeota archaeon]
MNDSILIRTLVPILLLIGAGLIARRRGILRSGDQRVLSAYVYYFALPALFFVNMAEANFTGETLRFAFAGSIPIFVALTIFIALHLVLKFSKKTLYLLILSTIFGSLAFFGIPFIMFAFPTQGEHLATLSAASISPISVTISITVLELYRLEKSSVWKGLKRVLKRLSRNPLILSILSGILLSLIGVELPFVISTPLHMLGGTTSTVAIFMLGVFLYGRRYTNIFEAFKLSLLRMAFLPAVAFFITIALSLPNVERSTLVLMHGMPVAISMIVLSERYDFYRETVASLILISSLGAGLCLNIWLLALGYH